MPDEETYTPEDALEEFGMSPEDWSVSSARRSMWQRPDGEWLQARRISVARAHPEHTVSIEVK